MADRLRLVTILVALAAAVVLVFALFVDRSAAGSWQQLLTRLLLSASFAGVAAYCCRESVAHRAVARDDGPASEVPVVLDERSSRRRG